MSNSANEQPQVNWQRRKLALFLVIVLSVAGFYLAFRNQLDVATLVQYETQLRAYRVQHPWLVVALALVTYVAFSSASLPGAAALSISLGWLLGFWPALIVVSCGSTLGAIVSFLASRYLLRGWVQSRFSARLEAVNASLARDGALYLFMLRLNPIVPYFAINLLMGLTAMPLRHFWWVSQLGMLPATCIFVNAGAALPHLSELAESGVQSVFTPKVIFALVLLSLFPLAVRMIASRWTSRSEVR
jgi:uncharacterized membrane protein YdjX (TVP38/TMEM64 family)